MRHAEKVDDTSRFDAIILLSGGPDSLSCLWEAAKRTPAESPRRILGLMFDYGQVTLVEERASALAYLDAAKRDCLISGLSDLKTINISSTYVPFIREFGLPKPPLLFADFVSEEQQVNHNAIPWRNHIMLMHALAVSQMLRVPHIYIGVGYKSEGRNRHTMWDTTADAIDSLSEVTAVRDYHFNPSGHVAETRKFFDLATKAGDRSARILMPMAGMSRKTWLKKVEREIQKSTYDFKSLSMQNSWSCATPTYVKSVQARVPCNACPSCDKRYEMFPEWRAADWRRAVRINSSLPPSAIDKIISKSIVDEALKANPVSKKPRKKPGPKKTAASKDPFAALTSKLESAEKARAAKSAKDSRKQTEPALDKVD